MTERLEEHYTENALKIFRGLKARADKAVAQVSDEEFFHLLDPESNSIAVIMKHVSGNMRSRWTDFLNSDGEKPDRQRDTEFEMGEQDRRAIEERWEEGWRILFGAVEPLKTEDLTRAHQLKRAPD